jgi:hypothetical protein
MPTNRKKAAAAARPIVRFFLAEDFRQEIGGKVSAIGLYADNVIVLQLPPDLPDPTPETPILIRSLAFLFSVSALGEASVASVDLNVNGGRKPFMALQELPATAPGNSVNLLGVMAPCVVTSFGKKTVIVDVGGTEHSFEFEIRRVPSPRSTGALSEGTPSHAGAARKRTRLAASAKK